MADDENSVGPHGGWRFSRADEDLLDYFACSAGVKAQGYSPGGVQFNPAHADDGLVAQIARGTNAALAAVASTLVALPTSTRRDLELVYTPHGWEGFLARAMAPRLGHGTLVHFALVTPRAVAARSKAHPGTETDNAAVLRYLVGEAGRGKATDKFFGALMLECCVRRDAALALYEPLRRERVKRETDSRRTAKESMRVRNEAMLEELIGARSRRSRDRFERMIAAASGSR